MITRAVYQAIGFRSRKNPPVGPRSGSVASQTIVSAACSGLRGAPGPPIFVRTHPGQTALTLILAGLTSSATIRVRAFSAALDTL